MADTAHAILRKAGLMNAQGEPRRLLADFARLRNIQLQYARELGMTPAARAAIGANNHRQPLDLAMAMAQGDDVEDVETTGAEGESLIDAAQLRGRAK